MKRRGTQQEIDSRRAARSLSTGGYLQGTPFQNADFSGLNFDNTDWDGEDFTDATLDGASLTNCSFTDACLQRASFVDAQLEHSDLSESIDLRPIALAGANISGSKLPAEVGAFSTLEQVKTISEGAAAVFLTIAGTVTFVFFTIAGMSDNELIASGSKVKLPLVDVTVPVIFFLFSGPILLFITWLYFHLYLQRLWEALAQLPAIFPDGRRLDEHTYPWLMNDLCIEHIPGLKHRHIPLIRLQLSLLKLFGWVLIPFVLAAIWASGLRVQNDVITTVHVILCGTSTVIAAWFGGLRKRTFDSMRTKVTTPRSTRNISFLGVVLSIAITLLLVGCSIAAFTPEEDRGPLFALLGRLLTNSGISTSLRVPGFEFSTRPTSWTGKPSLAQDEIELVKSGEITHRSLRRIDARRAFLVRAHLHASDFFGANFANSDFRASQVTDSFLVRGDFREAAFSSRIVNRATLQTEQQASPAYIESSSFRYSNFERAYFGWVTAYRVDFQGTKFSNVDAAHSVWYGCDFRTADLQFASFEEATIRDGTDFRGSLCNYASFRKAKFIEANVTGVNFQNSALDGADLIGARGLTQAQLDSSAGYNGAILPPGLH